MPKSKSKLNAPAARSAGLPKHPAMLNPHPALHHRLRGSETAFRYPDTFLEPTEATVLTDNYTISSNAAGVAMWQEYAGLQRLVPVFTGTAYVAGTSSTPCRQQSSFASVAAEHRMNAIKIEVTYIGAELSAAGYVTYIRRPAAALIAQETDLYHQLADRQTKAQDGMVVYGSVRKEPYMSSTVATSVGVYADVHHHHLFVASGLPLSTPVFRVRVLRYMEYLPAEGDLAEGSMQAEPHNPAAVSALGAMGHIANSVHKVGEAASFARNVYDVANATFHTIQPMLNYVAPRARDLLISSMSAAAPLMLTL